MPTASISWGLWACCAISPRTPRDLRAAYEQVKKRRLTVPPMLQLDRAQALAEKRIHDMDALLVQLEADSFGCF